MPSGGEEGGYMEEFEIEKDEKKIKVSLRNPTRGEIKWCKKELVKFVDEEKANKEDAVKRLEIENKLLEFLEAFLIKLNKGIDFKEIAEFDNVANADVMRMIGWLYSQLALSIDEGFLRK